MVSEALCCAIVLRESEGCEFCRGEEGRVDASQCRVFSISFPIWEWSISTPGPALESEAASAAGSTIRSLWSLL